MTREFIMPSVKSKRVLAMRYASELCAEMRF